MSNSPKEADMARLDLVATAGEDAQRLIKEAAPIALAALDQVRFAEALLDPPSPNAAFRRAQRRHDELIEGRSQRP